MVKTGRLFFAIGMGAFGIHQLLYADLKPVLIATWPTWLHGIHLLSYIGNLGLIAACLAIIVGRNARLWTIFAGTLLLILFLINHIPYQLSTNPGFVGGWSDALKALAISGGFFSVAGSLHEIESGSDGKSYDWIKPLEKIIPFGKIFFSFTIIIFGIEHFLYPGFVETLVPSWIPWHTFWTYFAGAALIVSGLAIIFNFKARPAAALLGIMIFIWFAILHLPRGFADPYSGNGNELRSVFESLAFSGIAFVIAGTTKKSK